MSLGVKLRNLFARVAGVAESKQPPQPETRTHPDEKPRAPRVERRSLEPSARSRQLDCARYADDARRREGRRPPRFAIVDHDVFT